MIVEILRQIRDCGPVLVGRPPVPPYAGHHGSPRIAAMNMFQSTDAGTPEEYIAGLAEPRRTEIQALHDLIRREAPDLEPYIASGMLAYGRFHYRYDSKREGDWFRIGLASRKAYVSLYISAGGQDGYLAESYKQRLPKADIGK